MKQAGKNKIGGELHLLNRPGFAETLACIGFGKK